VVELLISPVIKFQIQALANLMVGVSGMLAMALLHHARIQTLPIISLVLIR
jgi:hypothetical protein